MKVITKYRAHDGREFFSEEACVQWERWLEDLAAANELFASGTSLWEAFCRAKVRCGYDWEQRYTADAACEKAFLQAVTRDTRFSHYGERHHHTNAMECWSALGINEAGNVRLRGDLGVWSGPEYRNESIHRVVAADYGRLLKATEGIR